MHHTFVILMSQLALIISDPRSDNVSRSIEFATDIMDLLGDPGEVSPLVGTLNQYFLYTRSNKVTPDILVYGVEESITKSNYKQGQTLAILVHGWLGDYSSQMNTLNTAAFLETMDANVIVVDWSQSSKLRYTLSCSAVPFIGESLGKFVTWILKLTGTRASQVHLIGHSLGAHIVGIAGIFANGVFARVTGLDPAGPRWRGNPKALNTSAAAHVETINTDGGRYGIFYPLGHANFYPNGGTSSQPGCMTTICSHNRAYVLFATTVFYNSKVGKKCKDLDQVGNYSCIGEELLMGNGVLPKAGEGLYGLSTGAQWPY